MSINMLNSRRSLANVECDTLVDRIKRFTNTEPKAILVEAPEGATMKFSYEFYNGTLAFAPIHTADDADYCISVVAMNKNGQVIIDEIPLGETPRIRFALLNRVCTKAGIINFDDKKPIHSISIKRVEFSDRELEMMADGSNY